MKKKNIAALALTGAMALGLLSGCGQDANAANPTQDPAETTPRSAPWLPATLKVPSTCSCSSATA